MACISGPAIIDSGMVLHLDAASQKSKSYNVILHPENLTSLLGLRAGAAITQDNTTAPDGTQTADLITGTGSGFGFYFPAFPVGNATHSFFVKPTGTTNSFTFNHVGLGTGGTFTFSTKLFSGMTNYTGSYKTLSNGWYLVNFHTSAETNIYYIELSFDSINGGYIWGAQLTPFSYYREYVPKSANKAQFTDNTVWKNLNGSIDATLVNGSGYSGSNNGVMTFDGVDDRVTSSFSTTSGQAVTYAGWLYSTETTSTYRNFVDSQSSNPMIWWNTFGQIEFDTSNNYTTPSVYRNQWVYVALSKPSGASVASYYVNGVLVGSSMGAYTTPSATPTWFNRSAGQTWKGSCSHIKAYNRALTAAEIKQNFEATRGRYNV